MPPTFAALVHSRLGGLPAPHRRVITAAAVLGLTPDWALLGRVTAATEDDVLAALRAAVGNTADAMKRRTQARYRCRPRPRACLGHLTAPGRAPTMA